MRRRRFALAGGLTMLLLAAWACRISLGGEATVPSPTPEAAASALPTSPPTLAATPPAAGRVAFVPEGVGPWFAGLLNDLMLQIQAPAVREARPPEPPAPQATVWDRATGDAVTPGQPIAPPGGDSYAHNVYERPFNAGTQDIYDPDLDVVEGRLSLDADWVYVSVVLYGLGDAAHPRGWYGVELDLDRDGRGDVLVQAGEVADPAWTTAGVWVYRDADGDVGAAHACAPDAPRNGTGYERLVFAAGRGEDDAQAWARWVPGERPQVQLAFSRALLEGSTAFTWWVWADGQMLVPAFMNFHDTLVAPLAGVPYPDHPLYPARAIARVDNTCRAAFGFEPTADDYACGVCPPGGEFPPDEYETCPTPQPPPEVPYLLCQWREEANGVWVCNPVDILSLLEIGRVLRGEPASPRMGGDPPPTEVRCAWNPITCAWDCDDRCLPDMAEAEAYCQTLTPDPNAPPVLAQFFCERPVSGSVMPRLDLIFWDDLACQWDGRCLFDPRPLEDFVQAGLNAGEACSAFWTTVDNANTALAHFGFSLRAEYNTAVGAAVGAFCFDDDGDGTLEPGETWEACLYRGDACGLECETLQPPPETHCPVALTPLEEVCTGFLGQPFQAPGGTVVQCIVDDGDGQTLVPGPNGGMVPDEDDTNMVFVWDDQACEWTCTDCFYGPQCAQFGCPGDMPCPPPDDGPPFCDFRQELEDGRWLCTVLDVLTHVPPPYLCAWDPTLCDWVCEPTACLPPEDGPTAIQGNPDWQCEPDPEVPDAWRCVLPQSDAPTYRCTWNDALCLWRCGPAVCQPPTSPDQGDYCAPDAATGRWRCEGRGEFDECEWDVEECRWRCWNVCAVDTNGPDGCDRVIQQDTYVWTCLRGEQNLTCTFDPSPQVCDWSCQLRCEIPSGPPPACTYKYSRLGPGHWVCYDAQGNRTEWRYDLAECQWVQVAP